MSTIHRYTHTFSRTGNITINTECDILIPECLELELLPHAHIDDLKTLYLSMSVGDLTILIIPLRFMMNLNDIEIRNNKICVTIPFQLFFKDIKLYMIKYHDVKFYINNFDEYCVKCNMTSIGMFNNNNNTYTPVINYNVAEDIFQGLESYELKSLYSVREYATRDTIYFVGNMKGYYIECDDVNDIIYISLVMMTSNYSIEMTNNYSIEYNNSQIQTQCVKMSKNLLYVPIIFNISPMDLSQDAYNIMSKYISSRIIFNIKFNTYKTNVRLYSLSMNKLRMCGGISGVPTPLARDHIYIEYGKRYYKNYMLNMLYILVMHHKYPLSVNIVATISDMLK
jgi:hypothetical protein